jgi:hypothetical protein
VVVASGAVVVVALLVSGCGAASALAGQLIAATAAAMLSVCAFYLVLLLYTQQRGLQGWELRLSHETLMSAPHRPARAQRRCGGLEARGASAG